MQVLGTPLLDQPFTIHTRAPGLTKQVKKKTVIDMFCSFLKNKEFLK